MFIKCLIIYCTILCVKLTDNIILQSAIPKKKIITVTIFRFEIFPARYNQSLAGLTVSAYSYSAILESKIVEPVKKEDMDLLRKLSGEANNLNQLAHQANSFQMPYLETDIRNTLNLFTEIIEKLSDDWKNYKRKKL